MGRARDLIRRLRRRILRALLVERRVCALERVFLLGGEKGRERRFPGGKRRPSVRGSRDSAGASSACRSAARRGSRPRSCRSGRQEPSSNPRPARRKKRCSSAAPHGHESSHRSSLVPGVDSSAQDDLPSAADGRPSVHSPGPSRDVVGSLSHGRAPSRHVVGPLSHGRGPSRDDVGSSARGLGPSGARVGTLGRRLGTSAHRLRSAVRGLGTTVRRIGPAAHVLGTAVRRLRPAVRGRHTEVRCLRPAVRGRRTTVPRLRPAVRALRAMVDVLGPRGHSLDAAVRLHHPVSACARARRARDGTSPHVPSPPSAPAMPRAPRDHFASVLARSPEIDLAFRRFSVAANNYQ